MDQTILIVDDEVELAELLAMRLDMLGYSIYTANSAKRALELCERHKIELVLSDIRMPEMDGVQMMDELKKSFPSIDICFMTGYADYDFEQLILAGAIQVVSKPIDHKELVALLKDYFAAKNS